jgi:hypothetical protein
MKWFQRRIDFNALMQQHWRISSILPVGDLKQQAHRTARVPELSQLVNQALLICSKPRQSLIGLCLCRHL